jgi:hypothetical protein
MDKVQDLFKNNPILSEIGTPEQYREYLNTIFPNSKVKDILYHGTIMDLTGDKFLNGVYFTDNKEYAQNFKIPKSKFISVIVNIKNPYYTSIPMADVPEEVHKSGEYFGPRRFNDKSKYDAIIGKDAGQQKGNTFFIYDTDNIHILGNKQDMINFKKFVLKNKKMSFSKLFTKDWWTETLQLDEEVHDDRKETINEFVKYAVKELDINTLPKVVVLSKDQQKAQEKSSFGSFDPNTNEIWVYIGNRNMADILRTLAHELVHHKQREDDRLQSNSGETGSEIENEANATAGVLLRDYGKDNKNIYEGLNESSFNYGLEQAFKWTYEGGNTPTYFFTTGKTKYEVVFREDLESEGLYERIYKPVGGVPASYTNEGKPLQVIATVTAITLDFMERNQNWHTILIQPVSKSRYRAVIRFLYEHVPSDKYVIEEVEGVITITRKLYEIFSKEWWSNTLK